ncbi:MAG: type II secretion system F family protein [Candidatus Yonathbacteria bacterium]|nr:type II secretion system F family protein [Candidatus Yonathbacteria bacterium]
MPTFKFKIKEPSGEESEGVVEAPDRFVAIADLRATGKTVISVEEKNDLTIPGLGFVKGLMNRVKEHDLIVFAHSLSAMITAGLSLSRALSILERQATNRTFKETITALIDEISRGQTLSAGMAKFPKIFSPLFVSMVRSGEESGGLASALLVIGDQLEKSYTLKKKIKGALIYPSVVISALIIIGILMFIYVVPTLTGTFKSLNVELPTSTKIIIFISDVLGNHLLLGLTTVTLVAILLIGALRTKAGRRAFERALFFLPVIGPLVRQANAARTTRTLSSLLSSGVDMIEAITITRDVLQNSFYKEVLDEASVRIQKGNPLSAVFVENEKIYPLLVGEMIEVGEETGKLSDMLLNVAVFFENEVDSATKNMSTIIEPVLMVIIGISVGFFAVSMITPMYSVMTNI